MPLNKLQKKYIKRNLARKVPLSQISSALKITEAELKNFLLNHWGKEKFEKNINDFESKTEISSTLKINSWQPKKFLRTNWKFFVLFFLLISIAYANSLKNEFLSDDIAAIKENPNLTKVSFFLSGKPPFISIGNFIDFSINSLFGKNPIFYRLVNIFAHIGSTFLIFILVSNFFNFFVGLSSAGIFAVHSLLTESVVWISGKPYSLGTFFCLTSLFFYHSFKNKTSGRKLFLAYSVFFFLLGMLTNEKLIFFPIFLLLYELIQRQKSFKLKKYLPLVFHFSLIILWLIILFGKINQRTVDLKNVHYQQSTKENLFLKVPVAVGSYLKLIIFPRDIAFYHSELNFTKGQFSFLIFLLSLYLFGLIYFYIKNKPLFLWISLFFISLLPTLAPLGLGWVVAERYVYFGSIGIIIFFAWLIDQTGKLLKKPIISYIIIATLVSAFSVRTIIRNLDWRNQDYLWLATDKTSPSSPQNHNNLGDLYARRKDFDKAIEEFNKAIALKPNYGDAFHNVANVYLQADKIDLAIDHYKKALYFNPNLWQSHQNLGAIYYSQKKYELASSELQKAIQINPNNGSLHSGLGIILMFLKKLEEAEAELNQAIQINPQDAQAIRTLEQLETLRTLQPPK